MFGRATKWLLENILTNKSSKITVIDTFEGSMENKVEGYKINNLYSRFKKNLSKYIKLKKVKSLKGYSYEHLRSFKPKPTFDFIYIDGSHIAKDVLEDAVLSWRLLKKNGIMIFDDYNWSFYENPLLCPTIGIDGFLKIFDGQYEKISMANQVIIKKIGDNIFKFRNKNKTPFIEISKLPSFSYSLFNDLKASNDKLKSDLNVIYNSKTYRLWQSYCNLRNKVINTIRK